MGVPNTFYLFDNKTKIVYRIRKHLRRDNTVIYCKSDTKCIFSSRDTHIILGISFMALYREYINSDERAIFNKLTTLKAMLELIG